MSIHRIAAADVLHALGGYDAIIDARSEAEYAQDRLPGAANWPSLHDDERARVGTHYRQVSPFEARKLGAALVARNIAAHLQAHADQMPRGWKPLVYCWRGGQRSHALATVLAQIGYSVHVLDGGYKAFRKAMLVDLPAQAARLSWRVLCGPTGSGKTRLLHALAQAGAQVLDLEGLAHHRASVLGAIPGDAQPTQKHFDMLLWQALRQFDEGRPVFVEAESKKVGNLALPEALVAAMRAAPCLRLELDLAQRVALLLQDYGYFTRDPAHFRERLDALQGLRGHATVARWKELVDRGDFADVVRELLEKHYDPGYARSTRRNFSQFATATELRLHEGSQAEMQRVAAQLLRAN